MIYIANNCPNAKINKALIKRIAVGALKALGEESKSVSICFVTDRQIRRLNKKYRKKDKPTPVLSFSLKEGKPVAGAADLLGDVVISYELVKKAACINRISIDTQIRRYIVHGVLNLVKEQ